VLSDPDNDTSVIEQISEATFADYKLKGVIHSGMIPKLDNAYAALKSGVSEIVICGPKAFDKKNPQKGTRITL
jgi:acetylglutamate kinase